MSDIAESCGASYECAQCRQFAAEIQRTNEYIKRVEAWVEEGERVASSGFLGWTFRLGVLWGNRPWKDKP